LAVCLSNIFGTGVVGSYGKGESSDWYELEDAKEDSNFGTLTSKNCSESNADHVCGWC